MQVRREGGLLVLVLAIQESERVERQLKGRAGRQGDPGETHSMVRLNDPQVEAAGSGLQFPGPFHAGDTMVRAQCLLCLATVVSYSSLAQCTLPVVEIELQLCCTGNCTSSGGGTCTVVVNSGPWLEKTFRLLQRATRRCRTWTMRWRGCS